jgi:hypothetical protein
LFITAHDNDIVITVVDSNFRHQRQHSLRLQASMCDQAFMAMR